MNIPGKKCLAIYKGFPVSVVNVDKKIEIKLQSGANKSVRDKDILVIHPGPVTTLNFEQKDGAIEETWELLEGEEFSLSELTDFLYGDDSASSTYSAYLELMKELYFIGNIDSIKCNNKSYINEKLNKEIEKEKREGAYKQTIDRLSKDEWLEDDSIVLREIESLALEQRTNSKVLKSLGIKENSLDAHRFLNKIGYWEKSKNPYPGRFAVTLNSPVLETEFEIVENPLDLTHLDCYAIDDEGSTDPDDAISLEGEYRVWVHITDVASIIRPGSPEDIEASSRGTNLYLPTETVRMLPKEVTTIQALGSENGNNTLSFLIEFDKEYNIINREIHLTRVKVQRLSYSLVEEERESLRFKTFYKIASILKDRRMAGGAISISLPEVKIRVNSNSDISIKPIGGIESRNVVSEFMLLAGETAAIYCNKNNIPIPYATQQPPDAKGYPENDLASMFVWRRKFKRGEIQYSPSPHAGLGLDIYTRATSPLRRYSDLVVNQQIRANLLGEELLTTEQILLKVSPSVESGKNLTKCERFSNLHWKLVYLTLNSSLVFQGTYVEKKDKNSGVFLIEDLALETLVSYKVEPALNSKVNLKIKKIDIPTSSVSFSIC